MITLNKSDINFPDNKCLFKVHSTEIGEDAILALHEINYYYITTPETISLDNNDKIECDIILYYTAIEPSTSSNNHIKPLNLPEN